MKKAITLLSLCFASLATLTACGGSKSDDVKIGIKDTEGKTALTLDVFGTATTYLCFDMSKTNLGEHLPSEVYLKANSTSVTVQPYGYSREAKDYKWKATFTEEGSFTISAIFNNQLYSSVNYEISGGDRIRVDYVSPSANKVDITYEDASYDVPATMHAIKIEDKYMRIGAKQYVYFAPEDEDLYRRYVCDIGGTTWKKSKSTYNLRSVLATVYQDFIPAINGLKYKSKATESLSIQTVTTDGTSEKTYSCTKYGLSDDFYYICENSDFCLCLKTLDNTASKTTNKIDYTIADFPVKPEI